MSGEHKRAELTMAPGKYVYHDMFEQYTVDEGAEAIVELLARHNLKEELDLAKDTWRFMERHERDLVKTMHLGLRVK